MNQSLANRSTTINLDKVITVLEHAPNREEVLEALRGMRRDRIKKALDQTVKAARFDLEKTLDEFLKDGEKSNRTQQTYKREMARFLDWLKVEGLHLFQVQRADVNRYKSLLIGKYSANTTRLSLAAASSFYRYLDDERLIDRSPFAHITYPKREYKKALKTDQGRTQPVMNEKEFKAILEALKRKAEANGKKAYERASKESAIRMINLIHFLGTYGLRINDALTVRIEDSERFSYKQKGGTVRQRPLDHESIQTLGIIKGKPFKDIAKSTAQGAIKRITRLLAEQGTIRYPYSAHDFRHFYAVSLYQKTHDIYAVKEALGHATINVTEVYLAGLGALT